MKLEKDRLNSTNGNDQKKKKTKTEEKREGSNKTVSLPKDQGTEPGDLELAKRKKNLLSNGGGEKTCGEEKKKFCRRDPSEVG